MDEAQHPRARIRWGWAVLVGIVLAIVLVVRWPLFAEGPGPTEDVAPLVTIEDAQPTYPSDGSFLITTVSQYQEGMTAVELLWAWLSPEVDVISQETAIGPGIDIDEAARMGREQMDESQIAAASVALDAALGAGDVHEGGVLVALVAEGCPGAGQLFAGDHILSVDGEPVRGVRAFDAALDAAEDTVVLEVRGGKETRTVKIERVACLEGRDEPVIGAVFIPSLSVDVAMADEGIGGPSAGLAWALGIFDQLTQDDLTQGRTIAVTGGLGLEGTVYPIGGIDKKAVGARKAGADIFVLPRENLAQLDGVETGDMELIPVDTFNDAVEALGGVTLPATS